MRIVHVYKDYFPILGGIENHVRTLAEAQAASGHEVTVLVTNPGELATTETLRGVRVVRARRLSTVASTPLSLHILFALRALKPDVTHLHFPYPLGEISQLLAGRRRRYVITYHSDVVRQRRLLFFYRPLLMRVLRQSQRIVATSQQYIDSSIFLSRLKEKCTVIPLSVDPQPFAEAVPLIPKADVPVILFVGRHRYYKGVDDLLLALRRLDARLLVGGDGPMRETWELLAGELGMDHRVQFLGDVAADVLPALYASADIFVLPANSRAEAFGKVLLEAMAAGLPCITTELGTGTSYAVQDGITGFVVPPRQPDALSEAIRRLLSDGELRRAMGARGRERVCHHFTTESMVASVEKVYHAALDDTA